MDQTSSLFSLSIDPSSKEHLNEAARWARFIAIVGFVFLGFLVLAGILFSMTLSRLDTSGDPAFRTGGLGAMMGTGTAILYIILAAVYFFPLLYLLRFANAAQAALASNEQELLVQSFLNLKRFLRYVGILTIIALAFMAFSVIFSLLVGR
jgi:hypothetical protein